MKSGNASCGEVDFYSSETEVHAASPHGSYKRRRKLIDTGGGEAQQNPTPGASDCATDVLVPSSLFEVPDSEEGEDDEEDTSNNDCQHVNNHVTELESALPAVVTDGEAIAAYELTRRSDVEQSINMDGTRQTIPWLKGKSSIYVDAFNLALQTVLQEEKHLFNSKELAVFEHWTSLHYEGRYLYVRLFLRKTSAWHRISRLGYWSDISDIPGACQELQTARVLRDLPLEGQEESAELDITTPTVQLSGLHFTFADSSDDTITSLEEAASLLTLEELKILAKEAKVHGKNKKELLKAFKQASQRQAGLGWVGLKRSDSEMSAESQFSAEVSEYTEEKSRDQHFLRKVMSCTGPCIRLSLPALKLFERVHLVFYRSTEWTEKSLTTLILAQISRRNFPPFIVSRSTNIFPSRSILLEFEEAMRTQFRVDNILEFNGTPRREGYDEVLSVLASVYPRWRKLLTVEQSKEDRIYESGEGAYLRRFSPAWIYTRIIHKATAVLGRFKMHRREWDVLGELLEQRLFHAARRGAWYQRRALLEEHYMSDVSPRADLHTAEAQKRHWKQTALKTCERGLQDAQVHVIYHYDLQKRIRKLEKSLKIAKRHQHDFGHVSLATPSERSVQGIRVQMKYGRPKRDAHGAERQRSTKTVWIDELEGSGLCSVEQMCLSFYRALDMVDGERSWKGYHAEGGIIRTLFALLFYDVLFVYIPNVFQTPYQTCPLDLHTDAFYPTRMSEIHRRMVEIENGGAVKLLTSVYTQEYENKTCIIGLNWDFALEDLVEIAVCFPGHALATVCKVMAQDYQSRGGGMPDLFLWNVSSKEVMFAEVKSENDRLSDTQRLWIHILTGAGIKVELCNAVAREIREQDG